ncbi:hypothetical protein [Kitasatospora sp. Root107]|uniref:hypothetical protein n=1 Tax=Kitasatospora sp. Root107 TaxID=1736424 RepID=UPI000AA713EA|nr:hypothetical protein [Kitasatospora sp. Root107]
MRSTTVFLTAGVLCAVLVACSGSNSAGSSGDAGGSDSPTVKRAPVDEPSGDEWEGLADITYTAPPATPLALGQPWQWTSTRGNGAKATGTTAVLAYEQYKPTTGSTDARLRYDQLRVRVCNKDGAPVAVNRQFFALLRPDGDVDTQNVRNPDPEKAFPTKTLFLKPGECKEGTIEFLGNPDSRPLVAIWGPNGAPRAATWAIPQ